MLFSVAAAIGLVVQPGAMPARLRLPQPLSVQMYKGMAIKPGEENSFVQTEMRGAAMALHTKQQAPREGKAEAMSINGSLTALGRVIKALGEQNAHVPYRDAALTMLLRDSFGGKSCTSVVINVAGEEEHAEETICSLKFGERMAIVRNSPSTTTVGDAMDPTQLQAVVEQVRRELAQLTADGQAGGFTFAASGAAPAFNFPTVGLFP